MRFRLLFPHRSVFFERGLTLFRLPPADVEGTDLLSEENLTDINDTAAVLKLWFRELPEPLLTWELYHQFIDVASAFSVPYFSPLSRFGVE